MSAIPYMPLYIADYLSDAAHLSTTEHGAYMLLIMTYWQRGKALPADSRRLANIARMSPEAWAEIEPAISEFFQVSPEAWAHKRIESELEKFRQKSEKAAAAGKASAQRRSNGRSTDAQRTFNHTDSDSDTDREETTPLPPTRQPEAEEKVLDFSSFGGGGRAAATVSQETRGEIAEAYGLTTVGPLVAKFQDWQSTLPLHRRAKRPDDLFRNRVPVYLKDAAMRAACQPVEPPDPIGAIVPVRATSALANTSLVNGRRH
jgi:uncharacterized protein YdaU (DUF1376 family)